MADGGGLFVPFVSGGGRPMLRIRGTCIEVDGEHLDDGDVGPEYSHVSMAVEDDDEEENDGEEEGEGEEDGEEDDQKEGEEDEESDEADEGKEGRAQKNEDGDDDGEEQRIEDDDEEEDDEDYEPNEQNEAELEDDVSSLQELVERGIFTVVDDAGQQYYIVAEDADDGEDDVDEDEEGNVATGAEGDGQPSSSDDEVVAAEPARRLRGFRRRLPSPPAVVDPADDVDSEHLQPFLRQTHYQSLYADKYPSNTFSHIRQSAYSASTVSSASASRSASLVHSSFLPASPSTHSFSFPAPVYCGRFSHSGEMFSCASQDGYIHLYTTDPLCRFKSIEARDVDWAIIDVDFSHNQRFVVYSGWSNCIQLVNVPPARSSGGAEDGWELHEALDLRPGFGRSCMFSVRFNPTDTELLAGLNRGVLIVHDIERRVNVLKAAVAHGDDINTVCYLDAGEGGGAGNVMLTGSDDHLIKVWDRRTQSCIGGWIAHTDGLTSVVSCCDGQYVLSNSKDQTMKLHDVRRMNKCSELAHHTPTHQPLDYRYRRRRHQPRSRLPDDHSLVTYTGHTVMQTLIRCGVSPPSVNRRYVYSGSSDGSIHLWDAATGEGAAVLEGHQAMVREVHWSPRGDCVMSASWDETVKRWQYREQGRLEVGVV